MNEHPYLVVLVIAFIIILDFFVALAKSVFEHVNKKNLENLKEENEKAQEALDFIEKSERKFFNGCWLIRGISWIGIGGLYAFFIVRVLNKAFAEMNVWTRTPIVIVITVLVMYFVVLFTYILPDRLGNKEAEEKFFKTFGLIKFITAFFSPLSALLEFGCAVILRPFGIRLKDLEENVTEEEIISIVNEGQEQGVIDDDEAEMISNIISFDEKRAKDIMTHRTKMIAVDSTMSIDEALAFMSGEEFSRYPLFTDDIDNIVGLIHLKDVAKVVAAGNYDNKKLIDIARKPFFVPDTMTIDELFNQMQIRKCHMAVVVDEYGQTSGIVAMEDILEEIVGNIQDEFDDDEKMIIKAKDGSYILRGEADLSEVIEATGIEIDESDMEQFATVNGLIISVLGRILGDGERDSVKYKKYKFDILEAKHKMIKKCRLTILQKDIPQKES